MLPGVVREDEKASRGIFAPTEPVDASDEKHSPVQASERLVEDPQRAGTSGLLTHAARAVRDKLRRRHAKAPARASDGTASRRRLGRPGSRSRSCLSGSGESARACVEPLWRPDCRASASVVVFPCTHTLLCPAWLWLLLQLWRQARWPDGPTRHGCAVCQESVPLATAGKGPVSNLHPGPRPNPPVPRKWTEARAADQGLPGSQGVFCLHALSQSFRLSREGREQLGFAGSLSEGLHVLS